MRHVKFRYAAGDYEADGELSDAQNSGASWHLIINNYYWGSMWKRDDSWVFYGNAQDKMMYEDIQILGEMIEQAYPKLYKF